MKIVEINSVLYGSTGKIMLQIAEKAKKEGHEVFVCVPLGRHNKKGEKNTIYIGNRVSEDLHLILSRLSGFNGSFSILATAKFIKKLKKIKPDIIHIHNLHNSYINLPMLFNYIKTENIPVVWTLHDCWAFTGHCPYFTLKKCNKWISGCYKCPSYRDYPESFIDTTRFTWNLKKKWFTGVKNMTIITPSRWLANLTKKSFLKEYKVQVINNGIDIDTFKPVVTDFRKNNNITNEQIMLLGVAFDWGIRKGIDVFVDLYKRLDKQKYKIVLVGVDEELAKKLPESIIKIQKTRNQNDLAEIYSAANILINPTREDNYPTVNMESIACGTPVITFNTGGSVEVISTDTGAVVACNDINTLEKKIYELENKKYHTQETIKSAAKSYDCNKRFKEYVKLYENITHCAKCTL